MAIVMPFVGYAIYSLFRKHHQETLGVIVGSYLSINAAAFLAGVELGLQPLIASEAGQPLYNPYGLSITVLRHVGAHLLSGCRSLLHLRDLHFCQTSRSYRVVHTKFSQYNFIR